MKQLSGSTEVDLAHPQCKKIVVDMFKTKNINFTEELASWLVDDLTFHPALFLDCLAAINEEKKNHKPFRPRTIELLLKSYSDHEWNQTIPLNTEALLDSLVFLLIEAHGEDSVKSLCEKFMKDRGFDAVVFKRLLTVFMDKERKFASSPDLTYPIRDLLIGHLKENLKDNKPQWVEALLADDSREAAQLFAYLRSKDPYFSGL